MNEPSKDRVTLGVVPYLNALPLLDGLEADPSLKLMREVPSRLSESLLQGEVDGAIIPIIDAAAAPEFRVIPNISISSKGPVESVRLFYRGDLAELGMVHLDPASRSSATMLRILLEKKFGLHPEYAALEPGLDRVEAYLRIGDECLFAEEGDYRWIDLGEAWTSWTGLPFVYAAWVCRGVVPGLKDTLQRAKQRGIQRLGEIAREAADRTGRDRPRIDSYLREMMRYDLGGEEKEGIALFFRHAADLGLVPVGMELAYAPEVDEAAT